MNIAYVRVSAADQNEARQVENLQKYNIEKWFSEKVSAKDMNRTEFQKLMEFAREGDTVYIHDFSRIARSTKDLLEIVERFNSKGVAFVSTKENIDTNTPTGKLMLTMIGAINEFERTNMLERQREGITLAKMAGKYKGRKRGIRIDGFEHYYNRYMHRETSKAKLAKELNISRPTLDKLIREHEQKLAEQ